MSPLYAVIPLDVPPNDQKWNYLCSSLCILSPGKNIEHLFSLRTGPWSWLLNHQHVAHSRTLAHVCRVTEKGNEEREGKAGWDICVCVCRMGLPKRGHVSLPNRLQMDGVCRGGKQSYKTNGWKENIFTILEEGRNS